MDFTSTGLISQIKRRALIPTSQNLFTNSDFIEMLNEELQNRIVTYIMSVREDYLLKYNDILQDGSTKEFTIPYNAIGNKLNSVSLYDNRDPNSFNISHVPRLALSQINEMAGYYLEGNKIKVTPQAFNSGYLRVYYYRRPSDIVPLTSVGLISSISTNTSITCASLPNTITTGTEIDIVSNDSPFQTIKSVTAGTVAGSVINLSDTSDIETGFYVCLRDQSPYAQIVQDVIPLLIQAVVVRIMEYMGDTNGLQAALLTYAQMESDNRNLISPRVDGQPKKIVSSKRLQRHLVW
jgi:hypothetical protein